MDKLELQANNRTVLRKKSRFLRRQGITPTHLFGHDIESLALQCDTAQLQGIMAKAGKTRPISLKIEKDRQPRSVFIREVQKDPITRQLLHVDFYQVKKGEKIKVEVPIILIGESPAAKGKGRMLTYGITGLDIECLPEDIPSRIEVDVSPLVEVDQALYVKDITLAPDITVHNEPDQLVVKVIEIIVKEVEVEKVVTEEAAVTEEAKAEAEAGAEAKAPAEEEKTKGPKEKPE